MLEPFLGKSEFANHGQRVVEGQRLMQAASDIMLGWIRATGIDGVERDFYIRQLWDAKGSALIDVMEPNAMLAYAKLCGRRLPRRTPGRATRSRSQLPRVERCLRPGDRGLRRELCRPERARLRRAQGGSRLGPRQGRNRTVGLSRTRRTATQFPVPSQFALRPTSAVAVGSRGLPSRPHASRIARSACRGS